MEKANSTTTDPISKKKQNISNLTDKQILYTALRTDKDMKQSECARRIGIDPRNAPHLERTIKKRSGIDLKGNDRYDLTSSSFVKPATRAVKKILKGQMFGDMKDIKDSTVLAATKMVLDRTQPAVHLSQSININRTVVKVDLSKYEGLKDGG